jgi:2-alkyl-3-oxoalkanoate reductase
VTGVRLLITGGSGFVGTAVREALAGAPIGEVRLLQHRRPIEVAGLSGAREAGSVEVFQGDVTRPESLDGCCSGVDVLLHLAAEVGSDERRCRAVNADGTKNLLAEANRAGVRDVVYVSTAAVHGRGPHHALPADAVPRPVSAASRTRLVAETRVLASGGVVLRPFLTYGHGDRWFVPALLRWLRSRPLMWVGDGRAEQSVVAVDDLAAVLLAAVRRPADFTGGPLHVSDPWGVDIRTAMLTLACLYRLPRPRIRIPGGPARAVLRACAPAGLARRVELLTVEHTYAPGRLWQVAGVAPAAPMVEQLPGHAQWYAPFARIGEPTREPYG